MISQRQKNHRFYHFSLRSVCLDIFLKTFSMFPRPLPAQTKVQFKKLQFFAVVYDIGGGGGGGVICAFNVV